jgi:hypothetical protein
MAISQDAFSAISFLALCMEKSLSKSIKRDRNIETIKCKNGANHKTWSYYHAIVLEKRSNWPTVV